MVVATIKKMFYFLYPRPDFLYFFLQKYNYFKRKKRSFKARLVLRACFVSEQTGWLD